MTTPEKHEPRHARRRGPKPTVGQPTTIRFTPDQQAWLDGRARPGEDSLAGVVRRLVDDAMLAAEQPDARIVREPGEPSA